MSLELIDHILGEEFHILRMDESISEIMVNENGTVWTERAGFLEQQPISFTQQQLITTIQAGAVEGGHQVHEPLLPFLAKDTRFFMIFSVGAVFYLFRDRTPSRARLVAIHRFA